MNLSSIFSGMSFPVINRLPRIPQFSIIKPSYQVVVLKNLHLSFPMCCNSDVKEMERRRKIGHGNKGKVPWNKGKKHSAESLERISQRTKEGMANPKVRQKISECYRPPHSDQTKMKLGDTLRQVWRRRLKEKRSKEKLLDLWLESIAIAAKIGGSDQKELEWDSYGMLKEQLALEFIQKAENRQKAKEMKKLEARLLRTRPKDEKKTRARIKKRLTKINKKRSKNGRISNQDYRPWERINLDCVMKEDMHKVMSLADQIQAAKNRRMEQILGPNVK